MQMGSCYLNKAEANSTNEQAMTARGKEADTQNSHHEQGYLTMCSDEGLDSGSS